MRRKKKDKEAEERIKKVIEALRTLQDDSTVPKNLKNKLEETIKILSEDEEPSIRVNKALNELDEINDYTNIQSHTRTQIWNIVSLLEAV